MEKRIRHVIERSEPILLSETSDFNEYIFQADNYVVLYNTSDCTCMLIRFRDEIDASDFKNMMIDVSSVIGKYFDDGVSPLLFSFQRQFMKTLVSYFDGAKILCYSKRIDVKI